MMRLDVGCGHILTGDVNVDLLTVKTAKCFVRADAHNLPFKNQTFKLAYSSHMVEHLLNPVQALKEMRRVARKVEIYTPSAFDLDQTKTHIYTWNLHTFKNMLSMIFKNVYVNYTSKPTAIHGRLGKYLPVLNLMLTKLGFRRELKAICWN